MAGYQRYIAVGNLTRDPELRYTGDGTPVCDFTIAINEKRKGRTSTLFMPVTIFSKGAESCGKYLTKGQSALAEGRIVNEEWEDKDGEKRSRMKLLAFTVQFLERGSNDDRQSQEDNAGF